MSEESLLTVNDRLKEQREIRSVKVQAFFKLKKIHVSTTLFVSITYIKKILLENVKGE